jgi:hypothetical protein
MPETHERPIAPFADIHYEDGKVTAILLHDPSVEGLDAAIYLDGSGSMRDEYKYDKRLPPPGGPGAKRGILSWLFGWARPSEWTNEIEPEARKILEYLATKDRNGQLRVAYWSENVQVLGELRGIDARTYRFEGPSRMAGTKLAPVLRNYTSYLLDQVKDGARRGLAVIMTDGQIQDEQEVERLSRDIAREIATGRLPRVSFILVGVGDDVDEEQMERMCHHEFKGVGHLWCHRIAKEIGQMSELVASLVDETMTVAAGGTIYDENMKVIKVYEGRLPALLEFEVPEGSKNFTLEVNGEKFTQRLPDEEEHHLETAGEDDDH